MSFDGVAGDGRMENGFVEVRAGVGAGVGVRVGVGAVRGELIDIWMKDIAK